MTCVQLVPELGPAALQVTVDELVTALTDVGTGGRRGGEHASSRYLGVSLNSGRWAASAVLHGKQTHLGLFSEEVEAAAAYDAAVVAAHGSTARVNFGVHPCSQLACAARAWQVLTALVNISDCRGILVTDCTSHGLWTAHSYNAHVYVLSWSSPSTYHTSVLCSWTLSGH